MIDLKGSLEAEVYPSWDTRTATLREKSTTRVALFPVTIATCLAMHALGTEESSSGGGVRPPSGGKRSGSGRGFADDASCIRMTLGDFTLPKAVGSHNPGSGLVRASRSSNSRSFSGNEYLSPRW